MASQTAPYLLVLSFMREASANCDYFDYGSFCSLDPIDNLLGMVPGVTDEVQCQEECAQMSACGFFMFVEMTDRSSCFLLQSCHLQDDSSCSTSPSCILSITGPAYPRLPDACCQEFSSSACENQFQIDLQFNVIGEAACQGLCRFYKGCSSWTLDGDLCLLYSSCGSPQPCIFCTSGPAFPPVTLCPPVTQATLLLGGRTPEDSYTTALELITDKGVFTPAMPPLPSGRYGGSAVLVDSTILFCGGYNGEFLRTCQTFLLSNKGTWEEGSSMRDRRTEFGLALVGDTVYATGGENSPTSVESLVLGGEWKEEEGMVLRSERYGHCSVALGNLLLLIGGFTSSRSYSSSVEAYDTSTSSPWTSLASMTRPREWLACHVGHLEGRGGVYVTGGYDQGAGVDTVEFYTAGLDSWRVLASMTTGRYQHSLTMIGGAMVVAGGHPGFITSVETLNITWSKTTNLQIGRYNHAALTISNKILKCKETINL